MKFQVSMISMNTLGNHKFDMISIDEPGSRELEFVFARFR
jgi:hypothetical protein